MSAIPNEGLLPSVSRLQLWFGLLGGAAAWMIHFFAAYAAAEFGCVSGWGRQQWGGVSPVAWLVLAVTLCTSLVGIAATWVAYRALQLAGTRTTDSDAAWQGEVYLARAGALTSGIFVAVILFETIPVFFYLQRC